MGNQEEERFTYFPAQGFERALRRSMPSIWETPPGSEAMHETPTIYF